MMWRTLGFESQKKLFASMTPSHAYLFVGQDMIGKRTFALELAGKLAHTNDILSVSSDIDSVREAKRFLSMSPLNGTHKVALIDQADRMQDEAQNALLKVLEEPSASSILILITSKPDALLPTITSRCQVIDFAAPSKKDFFKFLEEKKLSDEQKEFLYTFSNGSIGLMAGDFGNIKKYAEEYTIFAKADINKRFDIAKKLADDDALQQKVLFWMLYLRSKKMYKPLGSLLSLYRTISSPQFNKQLALERWMIEI